MNFWIGFLERSVLVINFLNIVCKLSSWAEYPLLHVLLLDITVSIVLHDVVSNPLNDNIDVFIRLAVINTEDCLENWFDTSSLLELEVQS